MRDLYLLVDDLPEETMGYGDSLEFDLAPGSHRIKATNRVYSKTIEFELGEGETIRFSAACIPSRSVIAIVMMLTGTLPYKIELKQL